MSVLPKYPSARTRMLPRYVWIYVAAAGVALTYLILLGARPGMFASVAQTAPDLERKLEQTKRDMVRGFADIEPVRQALGEVKMDVANLKVAVQEASERDRVIMQKVTALESSTLKPQDVAAQPAKERTAAPIAVPPTPRPDPRKSAAAKKPQALNVSSATPASQEAAPKQAKLVTGEEKSGSPIETGSIARPVKVAEAPKPKPAMKPLVGVLLATGPSIDALRLNWSILTDRHGDAVKNLRPRYVVNGSGKKSTYALVAGPVKTVAEARSVCKAMEDKGLPCEVSIYRGKSL